MTVPKAWMRSAIEPGVAIIYFVLWSIADVGRLQATTVGLFAVHWAPLLLVCVAIGVSRIRPWVSMGALAAMFVLQGLVVDARFSNDSWAVYGGVGLAIVGLASARSRLVHRVALPFAAVSGAAVALFLLAPVLGLHATSSLLTDWTANQPGLGTQLVLWSFGGAAIGAGGWFIGHAIYTLDERAALEEARLDIELNLLRAESELQTIRERDSIAQDVHDIMAHSLSVIIAQADGARYLADARGIAPQESLVAIAESARESLVEVRMLIDSLAGEPEGHSVPGLDDIPALVERMRTAGLVVESTTTGDACALTTSQQMAVYRIVQESLTNAIKHAGRGASATLDLAWEPNGIRLTVRSSGPAPMEPGESAHRGIRGMTERAKMAGGWLTTGRDGDDPTWFVVTAFVPHAQLPALADTSATIDDSARTA